MDKFYSMIGIGRRAGFVNSGETGCMYSIKKKKCYLLIIANNASDNTKEKFIKLCNASNVEYKIFGDKEKLGEAIGKGLAATIAITDKKFSEVILQELKKIVTCK